MIDALRAYIIVPTFFTISLEILQNRILFSAFSGCLATLTVAKQQNLVVVEEAKEKTSLTKVYTKDDFSVVNRFESKFYRFACWEILHVFFFLSFADFFK